MASRPVGRNATRLVCYSAGSIAKARRVVCVVYLKIYILCQTLDLGLVGRSGRWYYEVVGRGDYFHYVQLVIIYQSYNHLIERMEYYGRTRPPKARAKKEEKAEITTKLAAYASFFKSLILKIFMISPDSTQ